MTEEVPSEAHYLLFGEFCFDSAQYRLIRDREVIELQPKRAEALSLLLRRSGELVTRGELIDHLWGEAFLEYDKSLNPIITNLREALCDSAAQPRYIETVRGEGYRFLVPVETVAAPPSPAPAATEESPRRVRPFPTAWWRAAAGRASMIGLGLLLVGGLMVWRLSTEVDVAPKGPSVSLAVAPFSVIGGSGSDEEVGVALASELSTKLAELAPTQLRVVYYRLADLPPPVEWNALMESLGVDYLVTGQLRLSDSEVAFSFQGLQSASSGRAWGETIRTTSLADPQILAQTSRLVARHLGISRSLRVESWVAERLLASQGPRNQQARTLSLRAINHLHLGGDKGLKEAATLASMATQVDPRDPMAWGVLANALVECWLLSYDPEVADQAEGAATRALTLDPGEPRALAVRGLLSVFRDSDLRGGEGWLARGWAGSGAQPLLQLAVMNLRLARGELTEAVAEAERASVQNPLHPFVQSEIAWLYYGARHYDKALAQADRALELRPDSAGAKSIKALSLIELGRLDEAVPVVEDALTRHPLDPKRAREVALRVAKEGNLRAFWSAWLEVLDYEAELRPPIPDAFGIAHAGAGDPGLASLWLERSHELGSPWLGGVLSYPIFDDYRSRPEFRRLQEQVDERLRPREPFLRALDEAPIVRLGSIEGESRG